MRNRKWFVVTLALLAVALTAPAWARGGPRGRGGFGHGSPGFGNILLQLIHPCQASCVGIARDCFETADSTAVSCITAACGAEVTAAQTACTDDRRSDACQAAVEDLRDCADACLDTRAMAVDDCHDAARDCRDACVSTDQ